MGGLGQDEDAAAADLDPSLEKQLDVLRVELRDEVAPFEGQGQRPVRALFARDGRGRASRGERRICLSFRDHGEWEPVIFRPVRKDFPRNENYKLRPWARLTLPRGGRIFPAWSKGESSPHRFFPLSPSSFRSPVSAIRTMPIMKKNGRPWWRSNSKPGTSPTQESSTSWERSPGTFSSALLFGRRLMRIILFPSPRGRQSRNRISSP